MVVILKTMSGNFRLYCLPIVVFLFSCSGSIDNKNEKSKIVITDMIGREVIIPSKIEKILAIRSGALRYVVYLNASDLVSGVEEYEKRRSTPYLMAHPELRELPSIGTGNYAEPELITYVNPDLIFCTYANNGEAEQLQKKTGIPVLAVEYGDFTENIDVMFSALKFMGKILDKENRADSLINYINNCISDLNNRTKDVPEAENPGIYIAGIAYNGSHGLVSTMSPFAPFEFVNAVNVASVLDKRAFSAIKGTFIDKEQLIYWNPEKIFIDVSGLKNIKNELSKDKTLVNSIDAFKTGEIYSLLPYNWYTINFGTIICNAYYTGKILYPGKFSDIDIEEKSNEIYEHFVGKGVYDEMTEKYGEYRKIKIKDKSKK